MDSSLAMLLVGVGGVVIGFVLGKVFSGGGVTEASVAEEPVQWWLVRETLTGTQLQILQYMEESKSASITVLQEKFSFIPDRELYYRLEQIVLMEFITRSRQDSDVVYELNPDYSMTVEDDKTVILPS